MTIARFSAAAVLLLGILSGGCATNAPPDIPSGAAFTPINSPPAADQDPPAPVAKTAAFSPSEVPIFRNLDPDRYEAIARSAR